MWNLIDLIKWWIWWFRKKSKIRKRTNKYIKTLSNYVSINTIIHCPKISEVVWILLFINILYLFIFLSLCGCFLIFWFMNLDSVAYCVLQSFYPFEKISVCYKSTICFQWVNQITNLFKYHMKFMNYWSQWGTAISHDFFKLFSWQWLNMNNSRKIMNFLNPWISLNICISRCCHKQSKILTNNKLLTSLWVN